MKKLLILICLLLCGCNVTYNVTTESDFQEVRQNMLNTVNSYGYSLSSSYIYDTTDWNAVNKVYHPNYLGIETYKFSKEEDSLCINLYYRHRCITEAKTIPYVDSCEIKCIGNDVICDSIQSIMNNLPTSKIETLTDGALSGLIIFLALLPFISVIGYATIFNVR